MSSKKALKQDRRGGRRENAGRKPIWNNKDTITIRVPKFIASQVLELAHRLDSGEEIESDTKSKMLVSDFVIQSNSLQNEIITKSKTEAIELAKKIIKHKKSTRISLARLISKLYSQIVSPEDFNYAEFG